MLCSGRAGEITSVDAVDDVACGGSKLSDEYDVGDVLGRGNFGSVRKCYLKPGRRRSVEVQRSIDGERTREGDAGIFVEPRAVKSVACDASKASAARLRDEVDTMLAVSGRHPNLPTVHAVYEEVTPGISPGSFVQVVSIVTDFYAGGPLLEAVGRRESLTVGDFEEVALQLLGAVSFLHTVGVVHRDIKPDNLMLRRPWIEKDAVPSLVLIDFGSAAFARGGKRLNGYEGTKFFAAPEVCDRKASYDAKVDAWSVGVCLLVLLAGLPGSNVLNATWKNLHAKTDGSCANRAHYLSKSFPNLPASTPERFMKLIASLLAVDPSTRSSVAEALAENAEWLLPASAMHNVGSTDSKNVSCAPAAFLPRHDSRHSFAGASSRALGSSARTQFEKVASFLLSVILVPRQVRSLVKTLQEGNVGDDDLVPVNVLEKLLWEIDAREAASQLELLREQTLSALSLTPSSGGTTNEVAQKDADLHVSMESINTLAHLHARHQQVYKAVGLGSGSVSGANKENSVGEKEDAWRRRADLVRDDGEDEDSVHEGMLMAMLTRATNSLAHLADASVSTGRPRKC